MGLPFNGLLRNLQFKLAGNPTPSLFPTHNQNQRLAPGGYSPTFATRGKACGITLGAGVVGGLYFPITKV